MPTENAIFLSLLIATSVAFGIDCRPQDPQPAKRYNPVIFVPGDAGSQLEAKLNKTTRVHYVCQLTSDWYNIWLNMHILAPTLFDCTSDNLKLEYNSVTRTTRNSAGVQIRPRLFGSVEGVAYLDKHRLPKTDYFEGIISTLEQSNNLVRDVDLKGAPYDFRKAPPELGEFFANLTQLIEQTYVRNNYKRVTLICHSMGCLNTVYLLNKKPQSWKDAYVRRLVSLGAPWNGAFKAVSAMLLGDNLGIPMLNDYKLQSLQSSFPSLMYLFPTEPSFAPGETLVATPRANYSLANLNQFFVAANKTDQLQMWLDTSHLVRDLKAPQVELWCLYGSGHETPAKLLFEGPLPDAKHEQVHGAGDGTVNLASLRACERWQTDQGRKHPVYVREFPGLNHIDILRDDQPARFIASEILAGD